MTRFLLILAVLFGIARASAAEGNFLNVAILELPPRYLADIPQEQRALLLIRLSESPGDKRLDYHHGWVHWFSDSSEPPRATSMLYLKLLPRKEASPLVLVHMPKPFTDGRVPQKDQTFVLERAGHEWREVTERVIPKEVDLRMHFSPRRATNVVEVAAYERFQRSDGRGESYKFGERKIDLVWDGMAFQVREAADSKLSRNGD